MNKLFGSVSMKRNKYNRFDLSHEKKLSLNMGELIPIMVQEIVPGDKFRVNAEIMIRLAPMLAPVMHRVNVYTHWFFVPNRLVFNQWEDFITGGTTGLINPTFPQMYLTNANKAYFGVGSLPDYMGIPTIENTVSVAQQGVYNALPFRAYQMIYNEYYRDQTLSAKQPFNITSDASDVANLTKLQYRSWEKDYFTSCLPWSQRGGEVMMPSTGMPVYKGTSEVYDNQGGEAPAGNLSVGSGDSRLLLQGGTPGRLENIESVSTEVSINELRKAVKLQEWLEKNARGGSRYIEQILSHFGVISSDARLQRPEYLGGGKQPVVISEVLSTFNNDEIPGGEMYGHGISVGKTNSFKKSFEEHGFVIGILSVIPRTSYSQGVERHWKKFDKFDYYFPEFAHLGEQEVKYEEIYQDYVTAGYGNTFGYQSRYAEYKYRQSSIHGDFRNSLAYWHMARLFTTQPALNEDFIKSNPTHRIFASTDTAVDKLYAYIYNDVSAIRQMPKFGTPML